VNTRQRRKIKENDMNSRFEWGWFFKRKIKENYFINLYDVFAIFCRCEVRIRERLKISHIQVARGMRPVRELALPHSEGA
jgi:hypothetical protein